MSETRPFFPVAFTSSSQSSNETITNNESPICQDSTENIETNEQPTSQFPAINANVRIHQKVLLIKFQRSCTTTPGPFYRGIPTPCWSESIVDYSRQNSPSGDAAVQEKFSKLEIKIEQLISKNENIQLQNKELREEMENFQNLLETNNLIIKQKDDEITILREDLGRIQKRLDFLELKLDQKNNL